MEDIAIRPFDAGKDIPGAVRCFTEGFHHIFWPIIDNASGAFTEDLIRALMDVSGCCLAAEVGGEVHAILFGSAPMTAAGLCRSGAFVLTRFLPRLAVNAYGMHGPAARHLARMGYGYAPFLVHHPHKWPMAEVNLFTSRRAFRGRGLGRRLMDAFVAEVGGHGLGGTYVCTDTALSYTFYEGYGFTKVREFPQRAYSLALPGQRHQAIIYHYAL